MSETYGDRRRLSDDDIDPAAALADAELLDRFIAGEFDDLLSRAGVATNLNTADPDDTRVALVRVLAAWRKDTTSEPIPDLVDTDTANEAIRAAVEAGAPERVNKTFRGIAYALAVVLPLWLIAAILVIGLVTR